MHLDYNTALGEILIEEGVISRSQLKMALRLQEPARTSGKELMELGIISPSALRITLEVLLADILISLGYADEREIFGTYPADIESDARPEYI